MKESPIRPGRKRSVEAIVPHKQSNKIHYDACLQSFLIFRTNFAERELNSAQVVLSDSFNWSAGQGASRPKYHFEIPSIPPVAYAPGSPSRRSNRIRWSSGWCPNA
jgi:hypothetical protein